jgi:hypothetical protein
MIEKQRREEWGSGIQLDMPLIPIYMIDPLSAG